MDHAGENVLGLTGQVADEDFRTLVNKLRDPATGERLGEAVRNFRTADERMERWQAAHLDALPEEIADERARVESDQRNSVHAWDMTFSLPKSWSVLHAALQREGRHDEAEEVWAAAQVGVEAALDVVMRDHAWVREQGRHIATKLQRAEGLVAAMFRHHTSRERDPQLHIHSMILNRAWAAGEWRALYSPSLTRTKHHVDAVFLRVAENELTRRLGIHFAARPDGKAREVVGVSAAARDLFSARTRAVTAAAERVIQEYEEKYGVPPRALVRWRIAQRATLDTRKAKPGAPPTQPEPNQYISYL